MNIDVTGYYTITIPIQTMFLDAKVEFTNFNIITLFGESFLLNRCINDEFSPIQYIALGNASNVPDKHDRKLGNETNRKKCVCTADIKEKQILLTATFKASQIIGVSEIGVFNDKVLISHDKFQKIDESFLGVVSEVKVDYVFQFSTGALKGGWKESTNPYVFYCYEPNNVIGVFEQNTNSWYYLVDSINDLNGMKGAYYYDNQSKNLYIRPKRNMGLNELVDEEIIVQVK